ncbi:hypothetical protein [Tenacibaculum sp. M341]|uniref:hypothetical protein n=1 Tax=Tenacibaculum sp. M341 TaxID=2530339 RepID=UPI001046A35A|nr:hypothetical protein [Tenacibaculum sp. M341]TCI85329.1 hypothetical protein EYW44_17300 [Tenacibaculum sp. M341]
MKDLSNKVSLRKDRKNLYIELAVSSSTGARIALLALSILILLFLFYFMFFIADHNEMSADSFVPFLGILGLDIWFIRSYLWNKFGKEYLIISKKTFGYYYDYGILQTRRETFKCSELSVNYVKLSENHPDGKLVFLNYNEETNIQEEIHPTSIVITNEECEYLIREIYSFLDINIEEDKDSVGFHYNK